VYVSAGTGTGASSKAPSSDEAVYTCFAVSPSGVLHAVLSDKKSTGALCAKKGGHDERHQYFRNMLGLDIHLPGYQKTRIECSGWVLFDNLYWLLHEQLGVILAVTSAKALVDNYAEICAGAQIPEDALCMSFDLAAKLVTGERRPNGWALIDEPAWASSVVAVEPCATCGFVSILPPADADPGARRTQRRGATAHAIVRVNIQSDTFQTVCMQHVSIRQRLPVE